MSLSSHLALRLALALSLLPSLLIVTGCHKKKPIDFYGELPPGQLALRKLSPAEYPDFSRSTWNLAMLPGAIDHSIEYMKHPSSKAYYPYLDITHDRAVASLHAFREVVTAATRQPNPGQYIDTTIKRDFEVYKSIGAPKPEGGGYTEIVLFTGYFTPIYEASTTRQGPFQWPLYRRPNDLAVDPATGETIGRQLPDGKTAPYFTRAEIEGQNKLAGLELVYLKSRWEAYVVTVQGSARLRMTDGRMLEIGYHGHNGHEYTSPGRQMVADGLITRQQLNVKSLGAYFAANPAAMDKYLWLNKRTVFFTERPGGPFGSLNVPVTSFASIATDKNQRPNIYPRAMPAFLKVPIPRTDNPEQNWDFNGFMMDQDSGGAIRAAGRCDIYMGVGDQAERVAGHQLNEGELYYIAVRPELVGKYLSAKQ